MAKETFAINGSRGGGGSVWDLDACTGGRTNRDPEQRIRPKRFKISLAVVDFCHIMPWFYCDHCPIRFWKFRQFG